LNNARVRTWTLRRGDVLLTVDEHGPAGAPAAMVLHGVGSSADFAVRAFGAGLLAAGYRVVAPDLRGHGRSTPLADPARHAVAEHLADVAGLAAVVDARVLAGVSLGAHLVLARAGAVFAAAISAGARRAGGAAAAASGRAGDAGPAASGPSVQDAGAGPPDMVLVALPGWLGPASEVAAANAAWADELSRVGVDAVLARIAGDPAVPEWVAAELAAAWPRHDPASLVAALRAVATADAPGMATLAGVDAPVGVVAALDDAAHPLAAATAYVAALPRAALLTVSLAELAADPGRLGELALAAARSVTLSAPR
jgi:pimeloyl-ACP methyl ester carboxylesterase